jgi:Mg2+ and Co2+ transporter CorA
MINETMDKIETKIKKSVHITDANKQEYLAMLDELRREVDTLAQTELDQAETISGFARMSTHEATRQETNKDLLDLSIEGLQRSVNGFESSNPKLVSIVNSFCSLLANIGI